ncbi:MAG TPA: hypothetical protein VFH91_07990 [Pyrinomonadaceae bacterium]|jgi:hypothetical protein|nr:hypothetical protein [Pyrinomonadaceae bacterium]
MIVRLTFAALVFIGVTGATVLIFGGREAALATDNHVQSERTVTKRPPLPQGFRLEVLVNGQPLTEYFARGRTYVEAQPNVEYELRIRNPLPQRVAVALSVDGLNTIDASHTTAWNASKWVIEPYQTITISGWQMSSARARRFYFTTERDSYGAKLGQTANLGVISAVFFLEKRPAITLAPPRPIYRDDQSKESRSGEPVAPSAKSDAMRDKGGVVSQAPNDEFAATGIGRSVDNDVRWINMELESRPATELNLRYEYYSALRRLGVVPRPVSEPDPLRRREDSRGFSPEP